MLVSGRVTFTKRLKRTFFFIIGVAGGLPGVCSTWRIIPVGKWLIAMVSKSLK